jgi:hypothetical protein
MCEGVSGCSEEERPELIDKTIGTLFRFREVLKFYTPDKMSYEEFRKVLPVTEKIMDIHARMSELKIDQIPTPTLKQMLQELDECLQRFLAIPKVKMPPLH